MMPLGLMMLAGSVVSPSWVAKIDNELLSLDTKNKLGTTYVATAFRHISFKNHGQAGMYRVLLASRLSSADSMFAFAEGRVGDMFINLELELAYSKNGELLRTRAEAGDASDLEIMAYLSYLAMTKVESGNALIRHSEGAKVRDPSDPSKEVRVTFAEDAGYLARFSYFRKKLESMTAKSALANGYLATTINKFDSTLLDRAEAALDQGISAPWVKCIYGRTRADWLTHAHSTIEKNRIADIAARCAKIMANKSIRIPPKWKKKL
jgi:hypothetical protein